MNKKHYDKYFEKLGITLDDDLYNEILITAFRAGLKSPFFPLPSRTDYERWRLETEIRERFNGSNISVLARRFGLTYQKVMRIVSKRNQSFVEFVLGARIDQSAGFKLCNCGRKYYAGVESHGPQALHPRRRRASWKCLRCGTKWGTMPVVMDDF